MPTPDYTEMFNTKLDPRTEQMFMNWMTRSGRAKDLYDYDLRGAFSNNAKLASNGHFPDTYKKPNHPTFSNESVYHSDERPGGVWQQDEKGTWSFAPSATNLQTHGAGFLQKYFKEREPDATLLLPEVATQ